MTTRLTPVLFNSEYKGVTHVDVDKTVEEVEKALEKGDVELISKQS